MNLDGATKTMSLRDDGGMKTFFMFNVQDGVLNFLIM